MVCHAYTNAEQEQQKNRVIIAILSGMKQKR